MNDRLQAFVGADIFDGTTRHIAHALILDGAVLHAIIPEDQVPQSAQITHLDGGLLSPGFVDLQVNGGGGLLFNDDQSVAALRTIAAAHARLGATSILPTLITDTPEHTVRAITAVEAAIHGGVAGVIGLHLEGPHLSLACKGAHDPTLIRPMDAADLACLLDATQRLPMLKVTVAPESVSPAQIATLTQAGILVSLGHSNASFEAVDAAVSAGATCVTHLFNAMSQLTNRAPGLVGTALTNGALFAGLIADGIHVHPANVRAAMAAKAGPGRIFLVSDAMAVAGTEMNAFELNGRTITRNAGRLTLEDGTLAGADLDLLMAVRNLTGWGVANIDDALAMATSIPGSLCPGTLGQLTRGARADFIHIPSNANAPPTVWQSGRRLA